MEVEVWSDVACPWCYVGKRHLEQALTEFEGADDVQVTWRSFELDPSAPRQGAHSLNAYLAQKYGVEVNPLVALLATDGCLPEQLPPARGWQLINYATSAVLEAELQCSTRAATALSTLGQQADVSVYREAL